MFHWVGVLNRFDSILDSKISFYSLPLNQKTVFSNEDKHVTIQILIFTIALWDNSTNRSIYNSYEHLINLLGICEPDILYWTLRLLMKPAQRLNAQKSLKIPYALAIPHLLILAQKGPSHLSNDPLPSLNFSYYRTAKELKELNNELVDVNTTNPHVDTTPVVAATTEPLKSSLESNPFIGKTPYAAHVSIPVPTVEPTCSAVISCYKELKDTFKISKEQCRDLLYKIRWFNMKNSVEYGSYFLSIRYIALVILAQLLPEEEAELKIFMHDPDLITQACSIFMDPSELPHSLRFITCSLIESISHYRGKLTEVLGTVNASANHGHIIQSIRRILDTSSDDGIEVQSSDYSIEFIEALFNFISYIISSSSGGNMLISAGLVPVLSSALHSKAPSKTIAKCIVMLDIIQSESVSTNIDVAAIVDRIQKEVDVCLGLKSFFKNEELTFAMLPDPGHHQQYREMLGRTPLLRSMMKLILHLQQTNAASDQMRRLIDSNLPSTIKLIFNESKLFSLGVGVFGLAVNIMSTFVHSEPTSLAILQEQGVVAAFLKSSKNEIPPSPEVVSSFPNAFGAICLNGPGLEAFIECNPIPKFLEIFTLKQHLPSLLDNDVPHLVGNSIDELIRHHPTTREMIMKAVVELVDKIGCISEEFSRDVGCRLFVEGEKEDVGVVELVAGTDIKLDMEENKASQYIDVLSRFIEGLFQNTAHCKEFMKFGGVKPLLRLYSLSSISYDFSTSSSSASVSYLFRTIVDINGAEASSLIYESLVSIANEIESLGFDQQVEGDDSVLLPFIRLSKNDTVELKNKAQALFRKLIVLKCYLRMLNDVYCSNSLSHSKSIASLLDIFSTERAYSLLSFFAKIARICTLEWLLISENVPEGWYKKLEKEKKESGESHKVEGVDSCAGKNTKYIYTLLDEIQSDISSFFRGILKTISHRRVLSESSRKKSQLMIDQISVDSIESLSWKRGVDSKVSFDYLTLILTHLRSLICEERGSGSLFQAYVAYSISQNSQFHSIFELAKKLILKDLSSLLQLKDEEGKKEEIEKSILKLNGVVDIITDISQCLVSDKYQQESPHTATLYSRLKESGSGRFDPVSFLIQMRLKIFPVFVDIFTSPCLPHLSNYAINRIVGTLLLVLKHEGEQSSAASRNTGVTSSSLPFSIAAISQQIFGGRGGVLPIPVTTATPLVPIQADPALIDTLVDMGFPRPASEIALVRCGNNLSRKADYLLTHPEVLSQVTVPAVATVSASVPQTAEIPTNEPNTSGNIREVDDSAGAVTEPATEIVVETNAEGGAVPMDQDLEESSNFVVEEPTSMEMESNDEQRDLSLELQKKYLTELTAIRNEMISDIENRSITLLSELESTSLVFGLKELLCLDVSKIASIATKLISSVNEFHTLISSGVYAAEEKKLKKVQTALYLHYHMLALIASDSKTSKTVEIQKALLSSDEFSSISPLNLLSRVSEFQLWISPLLLVLESYLSYCDEPVEVPLKSDPSQFATSPESPPESKISMEARRFIITDLVRISKIESLDANSLHVLLRLIARLTLKWPVAQVFVDIGGFQAIFSSEKYAIFPTHQSLLLLIMRHCLEEPQLLQGLMKEELKRFLTHPRARSVDLAFLIKSCSHIIVRSSEDFISAIGSICKLNSYNPNPSVRTVQVSLQEHVVANSLANTSKDSDLTKTPAGTPFKFASNTKLDDSVDVSKTVQYLTSQLISLKHKEPSIAKNNALCFLLETLCELFVTFPKAKIDFMKSSIRKNSKQTPKANSGKNLVLGYLLHEVIPFDLMLDESIVIEKAELDHQFESTWASRFLTALCYSKEGYLDDIYPNELQTVRVYVIDAILKSLKEANAQNENTAFEIRYGKIVSLANLCHEILLPKAVVPPFDSSNLESHTLAIAKIMIEKGFVSVFTSALASLDVNHPFSSKVVLAFLQPLDKLSSAAIKIGKAVEITGPASTKGKNTPSLFDNALRDLDEGSHGEQTPNEISDIFRNSALGMLEPSLEDSHNSLEDSDESGLEDEFDEFDEMDDEMDEDGDEDSEPDDDMEIVVPQPYHGVGMNEGDEDLSSEDDIHEQDISPENPFLQEDDIGEVLEGDSDDDDDSEDLSDIDDSDNEDPDIVNMMHSVETDDEEEGEDEDEEDREEEDDDVDIYENQDGDAGIQVAIPTEADLADIEDVFGRDNGNLFSSDDEDDQGPSGFIVPTQRAHRRMQQVFAVDGNNGIELQWHQGGRNIDVSMLAGRNPNNPSSQSINQDMTHPLLVNQEINFVGTNPNRIGIPSSRQILNEPEDVATLQIELLEQLLLSNRPPTSNRPQGSLFSSSSQRSLSQVASTPISEVEQQKLNLHAYVLTFTEDRWKQDAKLQYGNYLIEKTMKTGNAILNHLLPAAYEAKVKEDREKELKKRAEEEKQKEEEEKRKAEEEEKKKLDSSIEAEKIIEEAAPDVDMAVSTSDLPVESAPIPAAEERVIVMIDGNPVDITGSGIDATFLEALPDELRMEVVNQHFRERELSRARDAIGPSSELNSEFLDALPFEIREEVIRQERLENEQREAASRRTATARLPIPAVDINIPSGDIDPIVSSGAKSKNMSFSKESIQLVDCANISCLLRLVFVPDPVIKEGIYKLLSSLCENSKSRSEIINLLISVLNAGSTDLASVDRTFAQLTLKGGNISSKLVIKEETSSTVKSESDFVPNFVAQRCLEALIYLTSSVNAVGKFFLTESESNPSISKTPKSKKTKGKDKMPYITYPVIQLLNLLEQPSLLSNSSALEKLMHLLSNVLRPLSYIAKKKYTMETKSLEKHSEQENTSISENVEVTDGGKLSEVTKTEAKSEGSLKEKESKPDIKLPILAESSISNVVKVLKDGTTSSKSFQFTLSLIQYLCSYPSHLNIVVLDLLNSAQELGDFMLHEIDLLLRTLKSHKGESDTLNTMILENFTSVGATQAKFLRILKTIDFLFSKTNDIALTLPYLTAMDLFKSVKEDSLPSEMEVLERLYDQLKFGKLWQKLSETMKIIDGQEELIHVGTVLLPFIESFMVVSKPSVSIKKRLHNMGATLPFVIIKQQSELSDNEVDGFILFAESNKRVLNTMVRNNPSLMNGSFSLLVQNPKVLEFDNKRTYFTQQLHKGGRKNHPQVQINVRRQYVFEESYQQLQGRSGDAIKYGKLNVRFRDEEGVDAGGVTREWFSALALQMFNPDYALFRPSAADRVTYQPNRASGINPDHLFYFKFVGRIIGKAIYDGRLLDAHFTRSFYKCMISAPVDHKDMEAIDPEFYKSLDWILHNNITDVLDLNFSMEVDDFGRRKVIDLLPNGRNLPVTESNKIEYVRLVTEQKLVIAIQDQIQAFLSGFHEIIPKDLIKIFNEQELELLISGLPDIDIDDWKSNTEYQNYTASSPQIQWFWRAVRSFSQEERAKLIQFATGTSKVPLGGFTQLQGSTGIQKFQIHKEFSSTARLPSAHTCFNQIDLPQYESYEQLRSLLLIAINESEGFGFA